MNRVLRHILQREIERAREAAVGDGSPHTDLWLLKYSLGAQYLLNVWLQGGNAAVRAVHDAPPVASVHWMRALAPRVDERWLASVRRLRCERETPPEGFNAYIQDSPGALYLFALLELLEAWAGQESCAAAL